MSWSDSADLSASADRVSAACGAPGAGKEAARTRCSGHLPTANFVAQSGFSRRAALVSMAGVLLAGCGFSPAMAPGGTGAALRGAVRPDDPASRDDFAFVARIEDRLGRAATPRYALGYVITTAPVGTGITVDGAITRFSLTGSAAYIVTQIATGREASRGSVEGFTSWSSTGTPVATRSAEEDAYRRLMVILADRVVARLLSLEAV